MKNTNKYLVKELQFVILWKKRISHMNPPMPDSVSKEEMQNATIENDVIIEYITDAQG